MPRTVAHGQEPGHLGLVIVCFASAEERKRKGEKLMRIVSRLVMACGLIAVLVITLVASVFPVFRGRSASHAKVGLAQRLSKPAWSYDVVCPALRVPRILARGSIVTLEVKVQNNNAHLPVQFFPGDVGLISLYDAQRDSTETLVVDMVSSMPEALEPAAGRTTMLRFPVARIPKQYEVLTQTVFHRPPIQFAPSQPGNGRNEAWCRLPLVKVDLESIPGTRADGGTRPVEIPLGIVRAMKGSCSLVWPDFGAALKRRLRAELQTKLPGYVLECLSRLDCFYLVVRKPEELRSGMGTQVLRQGLFARVTPSLVAEEDVEALVFPLPVSVAPDKRFPASRKRILVDFLLFVRTSESDESRSAMSRYTSYSIRAEFRLTQHDQEGDSPYYLLEPLGLEPAVMWPLEALLLLPGRELERDRLAARLGHRRTLRIRPIRQRADLQGLRFRRRPRGLDGRFRQHRGQPIPLRRLFPRQRNRPLPRPPPHVLAAARPLAPTRPSRIRRWHELLHLCREPAERGR